MKVIKKNGQFEQFDIQKVFSAIRKSADRKGITLTEQQLFHFEDYLTGVIGNRETVTVQQMHTFVEVSLDAIDSVVAKSYGDYRNYKVNQQKMFDRIHMKEERLHSSTDKENSNLDSELVSTKRAITCGYLGEELYSEYFLTDEERQAMDDGYIYIHDKSARRDTFNCCIFDMKKVISGGFNMGALWYNEPTTIAKAFDVIGDVIMMGASQEYGGFTVPSVDELLSKYAEMSFQKYVTKYVDSCIGLTRACKMAREDVFNDIRDGFQGWEYKFNTVASSRGDYPFITLTFGLDESEFGRMISEICLDVRMKGQGKKDNKQPVTFPKLVFLYDEEKHGEGKELEWLFDKSIECSSKAIYPDYLSLTGDGYVPSIYKQYGKVIHPMGCRAFLSPWYERGGMNPQDNDDVPIFDGRFNIGAISLNLPMIVMKACEENKNGDVIRVLDYYLEMIRGIHKRTYDYLGKKKASINPLAFCEGGLYGGNLKPSDCIAPLLKSATASFGITALNETEKLLSYNSLVTIDNPQTLFLMEHINNKITDFKKEDGHMYAVYGTPAESLCGKQVQQFRKKYGVIEGVSDKEYVSNSFHCHVSEDITPIEKQDLEYRFWNYFNGGKIQYCKYPIDYNTLAFKTLIKRAMDMGFYEGVNLSLSYCNDCGCSHLGMETCNKCGSSNLTKIDRVCGYLSYTRLNGDHRMNDSKLSEIKDRVSM